MENLSGDLTDQGVHEFEEEIIRFMVSLYNDDNLSRMTLVHRVFGGKISVEKLANLNSSNPSALITYEVETRELVSTLNKIEFLIERLSKSSLLKVDLYNYTELEFPGNRFKNEYQCSLHSYNIWYNMLVDYGRNKILISHYLIELVDNDFKTPEQIRFEKQLVDANEKHSQVMGEAKKQVKYSRWAFGVSIVAFIVSLVFGIIQMRSDTTIDSDQFNQIKQTIKQATPPDVIKTKITNDTLTTRIVEKPKAK